MNKQSKLLRPTVVVALGAAALLSACGGGDDNNNSTPDATTAVPLSASESVTGFIGYLQLLVASSADMLEPVDTTNVTGPVDETGEPVSVN